MSFWKMETSANRNFQATRAGKLTKLHYWKKNTQWNKFKPFITVLTIGIIEK